MTILPVAAEDFFFGACAGNKTSQFAEQAGDTKYDLVTFTFGGNDIDFDSVIERCVGPLNCPLYKFVDPRIDELAKSYKGFLTDTVLKTVKNGGNVVVMGYPSLIEDPSRWTGIAGSVGICEGISDEGARQIRRWAGKLNAAIRQAVKEADAASVSGIHFHFVSVNDKSNSADAWETGSFLFEPTTGPRHNLCSDDPWVDGLIRLRQGFHPNEEGHLSYSRLLNQQLRRTQFASEQDDQRLSGKIAFTSDRTGSRVIWVMNLDGTGQTQLSTGSVQDTWPTWSPDGTKIAFMSMRAGGPDIWVMDADGTGQTQLTTGPLIQDNPTWSPDGTKIAFSDYNDIFVMNADGTSQTRLTSDSSQTFDHHPSWSPDGTRIAFLRIRRNDPANPDIFVMNSDGSSQTQLTVDPAWEGAPAWSPDGTKIAFTRTAADGDHIWAMTPNGTQQTQLTADPGQNPVWSPDGTKIAFQASPAGNSDIFVMSAGGGEPTRLTNDAASDASPTWQPPAATSKQAVANW